MVSAALGSPRLCLHPICQVVADFNWETMPVERLQLLQKLAVQSHAFFPLRHGNLRSEEGENFAQTPVCYGNWILFRYIRKLSLSPSLSSLSFPSSIHTCTHSLWLATASENQPIIPHLQGKQCGRGFRLYDCHFSLHFPPTTTAYCPSTYEHTYNRQGMRGSTRLDKARTDGHEARSNFSPDKTTLSAPTTIQNTLCGVQRVARERARHELQAHLK